jgi:peptidoglycan/LPS O-acetylase OafA/YrhL
LISGLLFQDVKSLGTIRLKRFWLRRGWKIWPAFFVYLIAIRSLTRLPGHQFLWASLFMTDYFYHGGILGHTWSLSVEEHFYLLLPLALLALSRKRFAVIPYMSVAALIVCPLFRWAGSLEIANFATHTRIDGLLAGVTIGYFYHFKTETFLKFARSAVAIPVVMTCAGVAALLGDPVYNRIPSIFSFSVLAVGFSFLVAWAVSRNCSKFLAPLATIGYHSYSIYLWHMLFASVLPFAHFTGKLTVYMVICVSVGTAMAVLIELPCLKLRDWLARDQGPTSIVRAQDLTAPASAA